MKTVLRLSTKAAICSSISPLQKAVKLLQAMKTTKNKKKKIEREEQEKEDKRVEVFPFNFYIIYFE